MLVTGFHCSDTEQELEQMPLGSAISTGDARKEVAAPLVHGVFTFQYWSVSEPVFPSWQVEKLLFTGPVSVKLPPLFSLLRPE